MATDYTRLDHVQLQLRHTTHYTTLKFSLMASVKTEDDLSTAEKIMLEFFILRNTWVSGFVAPSQVVTIPLKDFSTSGHDCLWQLLLQQEAWIFRPTPSWLSPGRLPHCMTLHEQ